MAELKETYPTFEYKLGDYQPIFHVIQVTTNLPNPKMGDHSVDTYFAFTLFGVEGQNTKALLKHMSYLAKENIPSSAIPQAPLKIIQAFTPRS